MHEIARIGLVDDYGRVFTANDPQWKPKEARLHKIQHFIIPSEHVLPRPAPPNLQGPSTAPAEQSLLKFWLKTRKSILNKITKFQIITLNRLGARIEKSPGQNLPPPPPQGIGITGGVFAPDSPFGSNSAHANEWQLSHCTGVETPPKVLR